MSEIPQPKFKVGDTIFVPRYEQNNETIVCPDCNGTQKWKVVMNHGEYEVKCQRCSQYSSDKPFKRTYVPTVRAFVIRSMQYETHAYTSTGDRESRWTYYDGMGSGYVVREADATDDPIVARAKAEERAAEAQKQFDERMTVKEKRNLEYHVLRFPFLEEQKLRDQLFDAGWERDQLIDRVKGLQEWDHRWQNVKKSDQLEIQRYLLDDSDWTPEE